MCNWAAPIKKVKVNLTTKKMAKNVCQQLSFFDNWCHQELLLSQSEHTHKSKIINTWIFVAAPLWWMVHKWGCIFRLGQWRCIFLWRGFVFDALFVCRALIGYDAQLCLESARKIETALNSRLGSNCSRELCKWASRFKSHAKSWRNCSVCRLLKSNLSKSNLEAHGTCIMVETK